LQRLEKVIGMLAAAPVHEVLCVLQEISDAIEGLCPSSFSWAYTATNFLLMTVVMRPKPLYLMGFQSRRKAADQSVAGNDIMCAQACTPTDRQRAL
jgi:hypothetical protein